MITLTALFKAKAAKDTFLSSHPDFPAFLRAVGKKGLCTGSVLTVRVAAPNGEILETKATLTAQDADSLREVLQAMG